MARAYQKEESKEVIKERRAQQKKRYLESLKFGFYCMTHPIDGFWKLTHEKKGTIGAATTILIVTILVRILKLRYTSFLFLQVYWEDINIFLYIASILFPLALWVIGNWALTTLFDGKGRLGDVYMGTCYGMLPYAVIQFPLMIVSNFVTIEEGQFYEVLSVISLILCLLLIVNGLAQVHAFSPGKNLLFTVASLFAMLVMIFILMIFFSMISQGVAYFISIGRELMFRI
ncbi:MAG: YIP1 family protein [Lachnospiraceae bacterium]|nr:YIP1 family protein [Lachnospiraceae bacterium]